MTYDDQTKEIHKQIQGHGYFGCDKGAKDTGWAIEGVRSEPQPDITVEAEGDKEHGESVGERQSRPLNESLHDNSIELQKGIEKFLRYYNTERHH